MPTHLLAGDCDPMQTSSLAILYEPLDSLKPDPQNERQHSKKQIRQLARSVARFGVNAVVLIDDRKNIIAGHARVAAAKQRGLSEVPTVLIGHLSPEEIARNASWDERLLGEHMRELSELN